MCAARYEHFCSGGTSERRWLRRSRQREAELGAAVATIFGPDSAAVLLDDPSRDRQAEANLARLACRGRGLRESLEDRGQLVIGHAGAAVGDVELRAILGRKCTDDHLRAARGVAQAVLDEIAEDLKDS